MSLVAGKVGNFFAGMLGLPSGLRDRMNQGFKFNRNKTQLDEWQGAGKIGQGVVKAAAGTALMFVPGAQAIGAGLITSGVSSVGKGAGQVKAGKDSNSLLNFGSNNPIGDVTNVVSQGVGMGLSFAGSKNIDPAQNYINNSPMDQMPNNGIDVSTMAMRDMQDNSPSSLLNNQMMAYKGGLIPAKKKTLFKR